MFDALPILIVEDDPIIAMCLAEVVSDFNGRVVGPMATVREAMEVLDQREIAAAILDAKLLDQEITPVALRLASAGIPLVVHSGTGLPAEVAAKWPDLPVLMKPMPAHQVVERLGLEMQKSRRSG